MSSKNEVVREGVEMRPSALPVISDYVAALMAQDHERMKVLRSSTFLLDQVSGDAFLDGPLSAKDTTRFWPAWFQAFPEMDYEVTRTIAAEAVVVTQWIFTGTNGGPLNSPLVEQSKPPTGNTIRFRGVSIYDVKDGLIQHETIYMDLATFLVEMEVSSS